MRHTGGNNAQAVIEDGLLVLQYIPPLWIKQYSSGSGNRVSI